MAVVPKGYRVNKKNLVTFFDQKICQKSDLSKYSYFEEKNQNLDKSEIFFLKENLKIWTRPDFYFSMQIFRSGLGDM